MMMVMTQHTYAYRLTIENKNELPLVSSAPYPAFCYDNNLSQAPQLDPRAKELLELLEGAYATNDDDLREILEAELFACGLMVSGGRHV